ncbi:AraC family transcriptional regulator [Paenibacillus sp. CAA11]|uniref:effector binding domain-containing protein n=1 Tax=Paenibacillus sp. CAA11 TaxID=1532905 RepID=UPI000D3840E5|nr:effector binding domain-containing protein [Paenibacillus sp. CAA11]AWB44108.1 AraC family transcriptional regulator [Paenibacillus sp. CAA11]
MGYYERIQASIDYMEEHLTEELSIAEIAAKSLFSPFHYQRLFQAISGFSVQSYIRHRRLSEAAVLLKETEARVLEIAVAFQYGSQEAFSRAFAAQFGITPAKYRKEQASVKLQKRMNFVDYRIQGRDVLTMQKPHIIQLEQTLIVGHEYLTSLRENQHYREIPGFYQDFGQNAYFMRIEDKAAPDMSYGIACRFQDNGDFSFIVGEAVTQLPEEPGEGLMCFVLPGGKYAEFSSSSQPDGVQNIRDYIYGTWLPNSNYERRPGPDFEVTDVRNSVYPDKILMKIYIPIE